MPLPFPLSAAARTLSCLLAGAAAGFFASVAVLPSVRHMLSSSPRVPEAGASAALAGGTPPSSQPDSGDPMMSLPPDGDFQKLEPRDQLAFASQLRGLSPERLQALLQDCLRRTGPERAALLSLVLAEWAESGPDGATEWILSHLKGAEAHKCLDDVLRTWAAGNGKDLAEWADAQFPKHGRALLTRAMHALLRHDPLQFARLTAMECNRDTVWTGMRFESLRTPGAAKALSSALRGQVDYISDPVLLQRSLEAGFQNRDMERKWGWNRLFEATAVRWHAEDPAACGQWLDTCPENARTVARHLIRQDQARTDTASPSVAEGAAERPPVAESATATAPAEAQVQAQPPPRPDAAAPSSGTADQQISAWSQWWRQDAAGAEAFLNTAAWPEDLKFSARVQAYSGPP